MYPVKVLELETPLDSFVRWYFSKKRNDKTTRSWICVARGERAKVAGVRRFVIRVGEDSVVRDSLLSTSVDAIDGASTLASVGAIDAVSTSLSVRVGEKEIVEGEMGETGGDAPSSGGNSPGEM